MSVGAGSLTEKTEWRDEPAGTRRGASSRTYAEAGQRHDGAVTAGGAAGVVHHAAVFFFQAEDGIRYHCVTGVQTCALPISAHGRGPAGGDPVDALDVRERVEQAPVVLLRRVLVVQIGRASCRERV